MNNDKEMDIKTINNYKKMIAAARQEFMATGITNNINEAVKLYRAAHETETAALPAIMTNKKLFNERKCPICQFMPMTFKRGCCGVSRSRWLCPRCNYEEIT